jgi:hypothetical protein
LPGLRIQKTVISNSTEYSISSREYKSTIIIPKTQDITISCNFPKSRRNKIAAVKSPRLLKKAQYLKKKKKKEREEGGGEKLSPNQQHMPKNDVIYTLVISGVQLEKHQDDSRYHVARNQSTSNLSHVRSLSLQDRDPA